MDLGNYETVCPTFASFLRYQSLEYSSKDAVDLSVETGVEPLLEAGLLQRSSLWQLLFLCRDGQRSAQICVKAVRQGCLDMSLYSYSEYRFHY